MFSGIQLTYLLRSLKKTGEKLVQGNQQFHFEIKLPIFKSAKSQSERLGAIPLLYLHPQIHPWKQSLVYWKTCCKQKVCFTLKWSWRVCGMVRIFRVVWAKMRKVPVDNAYGQITDHGLVLTLTECLFSVTLWEWMKWFDSRWLCETGWTEQNQSILKIHFKGRANKICW